MPRPKTPPLLPPPGESQPITPCRWRPPGVAQGSCPRARRCRSGRGTLRGDQGLLVGCQRQLIGASYMALDVNVSQDALGLA